MKLAASLLLSSSLLFLAWAETDAAAPDPTQLREKTRLTVRSPITDLAFSPDGKLLITVAHGIESQVIVWDVASEKPIRELPQRNVHCALFSPNGKILATAGRRLKLWEAATGKELATFKQAPRWMLFSADSKMLASFRKREVCILNIEKREELRSYDLDPSARPIHNPVTPKKPVYAVSRGRGKPLALVDPFADKEVLTCDNEMPSVTNLVSDGEEKILAGHCYDNQEWEISLWDRGNGKKIASMKPPEFGGSFQAYSLSPDGKLLVNYLDVHSPFRNPRDVAGLRFHEVPSGRLLGRKEGLGFNAFDLEGSHYFVFSPDGRILATGEVTHVRLWSIPEPRRKKK